MDFFNKVGETISTKGKDVAKKAKELAEIAALNAQILAKEEEAKKNFVEIGKYVYENNREDAPTEVAEKIANVDAIKAEIAKMKEEIKTLKGTRTCDKCASDVAKDVFYCPNCGNKMPEDAPVDITAEASDETEE